MDQRLAVGVTYLYQIVQTQLVVAAVSATPISAHKDNSTRSPCTGDVKFIVTDYEAFGLRQ